MRICWRNLTPLRSPANFPANAPPPPPLYFKNVLFFIHPKLVYHVNGAAFVDVGGGPDDAQQKLYVVIEANGLAPGFTMPCHAKANQTNTKSENVKKQREREREPRT